MGPFFVALLLSVGASTWIYTKLQRRTSYGNSKTTLTGTITAGLIIFLITYLTFSLFFNPDN